MRVGPSLVTLPVWAHASNGAKGGTVTVRIPKGFDVAVEHGAFDTTTTTDDGGTELRTTRSLGMYPETAASPGCAAGR